MYDDIPVYRDAHPSTFLPIIQSFGAISSRRARTLDAQFVHIQWLQFADRKTSQGFSLELATKLSLVRTRYFFRLGPNIGSSSLGRIAYSLLLSVLSLSLSLSLSFSLFLSLSLFTETRETRTFCMRDHGETLSVRATTKNNPARGIIMTKSLARSRSRANSIESKRRTARSFFPSPDRDIVER